MHSSTIWCAWGGRMGTRRSSRAQEMIAAFDIHDVNKAASAFNPEKLLWLNQQHMVRAAPAALVPYLRAQLKRLGLDSSDQNLLEGVIVAQRERAKTLKEMAQNSRFFFLEQIEHRSEGGRQAPRGRCAGAAGQGPRAARGAAGVGRGRDPRGAE